MPPETVSKIEFEENRLVILRNEKNRLEREIDILKIRHEDRKVELERLLRDFQSSKRVDNDTIARQLLDNKAREDKLQKTQMEVNLLRVQIEQDANKQKDLLLRKEVELDRLIEETKQQKAELAKRLSAKQETKHEK